MKGLDRSWRRVLSVLWVLPIVLAGCSVFPQLVRHQDALTAEEHVRLGTSYEAQGLKDDAHRQYQAALRLQKDDVPALVALGNLAFAAEDWKNAESYYRRILRRHPAHSGANNNLAMAYVASGKNLKKAERCALTALEQAGSLRPYVLDTLATIYIGQGRTAEARKALDDAVAAAPKNDQPLLDHLAQTRERLIQEREVL